MTKLGRLRGGLHAVAGTAPVGRDTQIVSFCNGLQTQDLFPRLEQSRSRVIVRIQKTNRDRAPAKDIKIICLSRLASGRRQGTQNLVVRVACGAHKRGLCPWAGGAGLRCLCRKPHA